MEHSSFKRGFTLIELLVVIAIIGILAGVIITSLGTARARARDTQRIVQIKDIQIALETYFDDNDVYPADLTTLATDGYMPQIPPNQGAIVRKYVRSDDSLQYHLGVELEQKSKATKGDSDYDSTGLGWTGGFLGASADCSATANPTDKCFDVKSL